MRADDNDIPALRAEVAALRQSLAAALAGERAAWQEAAALRDSVRLWRRMADWTTRTVVRKET